jgi:hypothetical protein
MPMESNA